MGTYNTLQRRELVEFLVNHSNNQYTVEEIAKELEAHSGQEKKIGKSTVYRLMGKLLEEGVVRRTVKGNSRHFVYQYAGGVTCAHHLHMKCRECGRILHMNDEESRNLMVMLQESSSFNLDIRETLLLGQCDRCSELL
ncbi:MAG: Fur family transcriptional regulator [Lachnospiraceae bacterium]|nr:Fur family transcriptional regulator [Lachnospiraceae bacterium]